MTREGLDRFPLPGLVSPQTKQFLCGTIAQNDVSRRINDYHPFGHALQDGFQLFLLRLQRAEACMLAEHSAEGHAHTMLNLQLKRPTLWEMETELRQFSVPLLVIVGDEDDLCLDGSVFLKRTVPTAALLVVPRAGHTINSEEPAAVNAALAELFAAAEAGRWLAHKPA